MTLPKIFSLASKNFNNFETMSFEATTSITTSSSLLHQVQQQRQQQQQQHQQHQSAQNLQQILRSLNSPHSIMSSLSSPIPNATSLETNNAIFDANANANQNAHAALSPLQLISENQKPQLLVECVMPGIYLTKDFMSWNEAQLHAHGFTHIIIIDKHIQELYYPNQQPEIFKLCSVNSEKTINLRNDIGCDNNSSSLKAFDYYCPPSTVANHLNFGKEFEVIELNFGEKSYLTTVLPNCYKAVKFINKALQAAGGKILVIDCNGGEQKCLTITVAYLMYKHNISFSNAFARLKEFYNKADLDRFYSSQLYEYEPILQVQRAQSRGHSCSRELAAAILKRKKSHDEDDATLDNNSTSAASSSSCCYNFTNTSASTNTNATTTTESLLSNCNPLSRFNSTQMERQQINSLIHHKNTMAQDNPNTPTFSHFISAMTLATTAVTSTTAASSSSSSLTTTTTGGWYNWDDYAME